MLYFYQGAVAPLLERNLSLLEANPSPETTHIFFCLIEPSFATEESVDTMAGCASATSVLRPGAEREAPGRLPGGYRPLLAIPL